jgi:FixJ family two-component response regulator/phosphate uptake regulator
MHMGDVVERMLRQVMTALMTDDRGLVSEVSRMDNTVDRLDEAIKLYVTKLTKGRLDEREGRRAMEIISFAINLEHIGDIIDKNLCEVAAKKIKRRLQFSNEGAAELMGFHTRVLDSLKIAFGTFMSGDAAEARKLLAEKAQLRSAELTAAERHLERLREGRPETLETTSLHLDILRDLKRIHSHICSAAYSVLDGAGQTLVVAVLIPHSSGCADFPLPVLQLRLGAGLPDTMAGLAQIALVEDDAAVRDSMQLYLASQDLKTSCFASGEALLAAVDGGVQFDCVVTDVRMPGLLGLDLIHHLKARRVVAPIILITGHGDADMAVSAIKSGAFNFIEKPFNEARLLASIKNALEIARQQAADSAQINELYSHLQTLSERQVMELAVTRRSV